MTKNISGDGDIELHSIYEVHIYRDIWVLDWLLSNISDIKKGHFHFYSLGRRHCDYGGQ